MSMMNDQPSQCAAMVRLLNDELQWHLSSAQQAGYVRQILTYLPDVCPDAKLCKIVGYYHADHELVQALQNHHPDTWCDWMPQVVAILRSAGLTWSSDVAVDSDDLVQVARMELVRALPSFRYASRFSTWAYQVIVQSVQRFLRDSQALKRAGRPDSLDHLPDYDIPVRQGDYLETQPEAQLLLERIEKILGQQEDHRLAYLFRIWAVNDLRVEEIGKLVQLHPSRVRTLLARARAVLREHADIRSWVVDDR